MTSGPPRVLVAGDANVDLVLRGDVRPRFGQVEQLLDDGALVLGSSAGIAACGLARLGIPTDLVAVMGDDAFGRFAREELTTRGVGTEAVRVHAELATGLSVILSAPEDRAILTAIGALGELTADDLLAAAEGHDHVHVASFYLLPRLMPGLGEVFAELHRRGLTTSIDTNWDPAETWAHVAEVLPHADILLPNAQELRGIAGALGVRDDDDHDLGRAVAALGPEVVVKDGARGGWSVGAGGQVTAVAARPVKVVDTTGAGDSFDAGYLAARLSGVSDPRERLRWAVAAGSLSTRGAGGTGAQATRAEVLQALRALP
ncbi:sugar kinase [Pseudolysinimonas kribbensis]|uniref:Sugar kinase n=1 Tax=Pseudolysinimonas kribbensis TaxID=433641 RepID=A0ABQ6K222_9MICO|nr:carbohydrate kinase family protein [Pseudolysinimonas kribbensis]GMA94493.1 sugar kinase [Pseudolysinimonas kribbensis]